MPNFLVIIMSSTGTDRLINLFGGTCGVFSVITFRNPDRSVLESGVRDFPDLEKLTIDRYFFAFDGMDHFAKTPYRLRDSTRVHIF